MYNGNLGGGGGGGQFSNDLQELYPHVSLPNSMFQQNYQDYYQEKIHQLSGIIYICLFVLYKLYPAYHGILQHQLFVPEHLDI